MRLLRSIFLAKFIYHNETICRRYIDDSLFWPELYQSGVSMYNVNIWIAMKDMLLSRDGNILGLAPSLIKETDLIPNRYKVSVRICILIFPWLSIYRKAVDIFVQTIKSLKLSHSYEIDLKDVNITHHPLLFWIVVYVDVLISIYSQKRIFIS